MVRGRLLMLLLLFCSLSSWAQDIGAIDSSTFETPDTRASFPGGTDARHAYIKENLHYPELAWLNHITSNVITLFVVNEKGAISTIQPAADAPSLLNNAVIDLIKEMPRWQPATKDGHPVKSVCRLPLGFTLKGLSYDDSIRLAEAGTNVTVEDWTSFSRLPDTDIDLEEWTHVVLQPSVYMRVKFMRPLKKWPQLILSVVINESGVMEQPKVVYSDHPFFTTYVLGMIDKANKNPMWHPAQKDGKDTACNFLLKFYFRPSH